MLAGIKDIRIINEFTALALAYNYINNISYLKINDVYKDKKILVFDFGGKNIKVTILKILDINQEKFEILSNKEDKFLGGENFNDKLLDYFLDKFCEKYKKSKENIRKDKKIIKRLKFACEYIKKYLSIAQVEQIKINFYEHYEQISRYEFENICYDLFEKIIILVGDALNDAKIKKNEINEIMLVGGSSKIPKIKTLFNKYFKINNKKESNGIIIKDLINPDEVIAYGTTLMAKYILDKNSEFIYSNLFDIIPFSLGINIENKSRNPEIKREGDLMEVIIKRGTKIPCTNTFIYETYKVNQKQLKINIFEGDKKYVKYNNLLGEILIDLSLKRKGKIKFYLKFAIKINGILTITAKENNNLYNFEIKNYMNLLEQNIIKIKEKYAKLFPKEINKYIDFTNLKESFKKLKQAYGQSEDEDEKYEILKCYSSILEDFINLFDKNNNNETLFEKYYIYIKELITSFIKMLNMKEQLTNVDEENIINKIIINILIFINNNLGYLNNLVEMMKILPKNIFYKIVAIIIEKLNELGKKCLKERKRFCYYQSLAYFEKAYLFFIKYIIDFKNINICGEKIKEKFKSQLVLSISYIISLNKKEIPINNFSLKSNKFFVISDTTEWHRKYFHYLQINRKEEEEKYKLILNNYENILKDFSDKICKEKAICIANILTISIRMLGYWNSRLYNKLGEYVEFIVNHLKLDKNECWYK